MLERVHRPVCVGVLALSLCATAVWCEEKTSSAPPGNLSEILQMADQARRSANEATRRQQQAIQEGEAGEELSDVQTAPRPVPARKGAAKPAGGAKKKAADAKESPRGFSDIRQTLEGAFDLHVQDADVRTVLRQLSAQSKKNIVTSSKVSGTVTADLYGVEFSEALAAVVEAAGLVSQEQQDVIYVFTPEEMEQRRQNMPMESRVFHLAYLRAATAKELISGLLSPRGKATITEERHQAVSIEALPPPTWSDHRTRNSAVDVLVVYDYEYVLEKVARVLEKADVKPDQVLVEATILSAQLDDDNALGVDLQALVGTSFNTFGATSDLTAMTNMSITEDTPNVGVKDFRDWQSRFGTNFTGNMPTDYGAPFTFGIVYDNIGAFLQALESVRDVTVLANPKLLIVNKQRGEMLVGRSDGYLTTVVTDTSAIQQVEFLETGTKLIVRPFIGENDYIRMEIHPEDSIGSVVSVAEGQPALPRKTTTEVTTNILVRDGKTIVIAGLFRDEVETVRRQVPILGDVPWLGTAFRSTVDSTTRAEVIILITPHILREASAEAVGERLLGTVERYRIGARRGLRWWGRHRLSAEYLRRANLCWTEGDVDKAQWWLDLCLSLQPDLVEAMVLKEQMTGQASWAHPPQYTDCRYLVTRMLMQEIGRDVDTILPPRRPLDDGELDPAVRKALGVELQPTTSGVIRRPERYVPVPRGDSSLPGAVDRKPAGQPTPPAVAPTPSPKEKEKKEEKTPVAPPPAGTRSAPAGEPRPAVQPAPATPAKSAPVPPAAPAAPAPAQQPEASPSEQSEKPRPAPIEEPPVSPTPEPNLSPAARAQPTLAAPPPLSDVLPVEESRPPSPAPAAPGKPTPAPTSVPPVERPETRQPLEEYKSPVRRHLESETLSALLKEKS